MHWVPGSYLQEGVVTTVYPGSNQAKEQNSAKEEERQVSFEGEEFSFASYFENTEEKQFKEAK